MKLTKEGGRKKNVLISTKSRFPTRVNFTVLKHGSKRRKEKSISDKNNNEKMHTFLLDPLLWEINQSQETKSLLTFCESSPLFWKKIPNA